MAFLFSKRNKNQVKGSVRGRTRAIHLAVWSLALIFTLGLAACGRSSGETAPAGGGGAAAVTSIVGNRDASAAGSGTTSATGSGTTSATGSANASADAFDPTAYLAEEAYLAPLIALTWETDADGISGIRHRKLENLAGFLDQCRQPIVLAFYDELADHSHSLIPELEQVAADYKGRAYVILAQPTAKEDILAYFPKDFLPVTYLIEDSEIQSNYQGWSDEVLADLKRDLDGLLVSTEQQTETGQTGETGAAGAAGAVN